MALLEISTAAMSTNSELLIIICSVASAIIVIASFLHEKISAFNRRHGLVSYSEARVKSAAWNGGMDGVDECGVPFYGVVDDENAEVAVAAETGNIGTVHNVTKKVNRYGSSRNHAA